MAKNPTGQGFPSLNQIFANPIRGKKGQTPKIDLALDLSTTCVGWAVGADRNLERHGKFVFKTTAGGGEKLVAFEEYLRGLLDGYTPDRLLVEKPSAKGKTSERHNELMGIVRKVWFEKTGLELEADWIIHPRTIKTAMKVPRGNSYDANKIIMVNKINHLYGLSLRYDRNSKYKSDDDIADAIAVMTAHWRRSK